MKTIKAMNRLLIFLLLPMISLADVKIGNLFEIKDTWTASSGEKIKLSRWQGQTLVVSLFYSTCRTICPMTVSEMKQIEKKLGDKAEHVQFLLFTIDPQHDQPAEMASYKKKHGIDRPNWHLILGGELATRKLAAALSMGYAEPQANRDLHRMHSKKIVLVRTVGEGKDRKVTHQEVTPENIERWME